MLATLAHKHLVDYWHCPACGDEGEPRQGNNELGCGSCGAIYPILHGVPVLVRPHHEIFSIDKYARFAKRKKTRREFLSRLAPSPSVNLGRARVLRTLEDELTARWEMPYVLVLGAGKQADRLARAFNKPLILISTDIDPSSPIDLICDAHDLPFRAGSFQGVVATAVLEHVLYPERVAGEIARVLCESGVVYSELPFIQQVHEGAYDFTRYTHSGHRRLFNAFREIDSGVVAGPATALVWSLERFAGSLVPSKNAATALKLMSRLFFFWIKYLDYVMLNEKAALDAASCTYFLGFRERGYTRSDLDIIQSYTGGEEGGPGVGPAETP